MTGMKIEKITHIDVSRWIPNIVWTCMKSKGIEWAATRATVSNYYKDPTYDIYYDGARSVDIIIPPYHVTRADKTIEGISNSAKVQMDFFAKAIEGRHDGVVILDVELQMDYFGKVLLPKQQITDVNMECLEIAEQRYDFVYWYSRASFMDAYMAIDNRFKRLNLFLAEYGLDDGLWYGSNLIPKGCTKDQVVIHQFTGKGKPFCCDKIVNALDYDLVINRERYNEIHKIDSTPEIPPTGATWDEARVVLLENRVTQLEERLDNAKLTL